MNLYSILNVAQSLPKLADIVTVLFLSSLTSKLLSRMLIVLLLPKYTFS